MPLIARSAVHHAECGVVFAEADAVANGEILRLLIDIAHVFDRDGEWGVFSRHCAGLNQFGFDRLIENGNVLAGIGKNKAVFGVFSAVSRQIITD